MSFVIYIDKDGQPVRQMVPTNPESAARYRRMTVFTQDEVDGMLDEADDGTCCPDCRSEHYQEGYSDGKLEVEARVEEVEARVEELGNALAHVDEELSTISVVVEDTRQHIRNTGVCV